MIFVPIIVVILFVIVFTPSTPRRGRRSGYRRRYKGFLLGLADEMERDRKRRSRHSGVMCGPGGVGPRGGRRR